jgi:hypothetical protein
MLLDQVCVQHVLDTFGEKVQSVGYYRMDITILHLVSADWTLCSKLTRSI